LPQLSQQLLALGVRRIRPRRLATCRTGEFRQHRDHLRIGEDDAAGARESVALGDLGDLPFDLEQRGSKVSPRVSPFFLHTSAPVGL